MKTALVRLEQSHCPVTAAAVPYDNKTQGRRGVELPECNSFYLRNIVNTRIRLGSANFVFPIEHLLESKEQFHENGKVKPA